MKDNRELEAIRTSGHILAQVLDLLARQAQPGTTPKDLETMATSELKKLGGEPAFLRYQGYPSLVCISVNEDIVHGIPTDRELKAGDLVGIDFGVRYEGMITDSARTIIVGGSAAPAAQRLLKATEEAMYAGIDVVKPGAHVGDIGAAVERRLRADNLGIVTKLVGHGVGHKVHEPPEIPNVGTAGQGPVLRANTAIAIEPMATLGSGDVEILDDGWTVRTRDGSLSAHFEHTVLITDDGYEILTQQ